MSHRSSAALKPLLAKHVEFYDEVLAHVFFAEISTFVEDLDDRKQQDTTASMLLESIFRALDACFERADEDGRNLISVSFIENVMDRAYAQPAFRSRFGPALRRDLGEMLVAAGFDDPRDA